MSNRLFIVMLRRPRKNDARADPFWEFGSFGCTGCHGKNLLHPKKCKISEGDRLAFIQGGHLGSRLLLVTPPIKRIDYEGRVELRWDSAKKPFRYASALPLFVRSGKHRLFPRLSKSLMNINRSTVDAKFASRFRARTSPLEPNLEVEIETAFNTTVNNTKKSDCIVRYEEALPWCDCPASPDERRRDYQQRLKELRKPTASLSSKINCHT